ncbi:uncharacterized protein GIQ15_04484 [Arthroderma uncinatum]|uniref:uncharacterized protein n=1 Tax=Arthroderma uncinatum TaxID=74035 RepID=UPI00144A8062|nr:uncharacterized protein GIQ15_04484 [Arthroderma uncinatum]KAF3481725.1 hypothetical protein GIQ15_04484 [Arthroderma uncinatum]
MSSFFKKPAWAQAKTPAKPTDFYRRSNQVYSDFVATAQDDEDSEDETIEKPETKYKTNDSKRRRISTEDEPAVISSSESRGKTPAQLDTNGATAKDPTPKLEPTPKTEPTTSRTPPRTSQVARTSPRRLNPRKSPLKSASPPSNVIRLSSESPPPPAARVPPTIVLKDDTDSDNDGDKDDESDEECAELVRRARERARNRAAEAESKSKSPTSKDTAQLGQPSNKTGSPSKPATAPKSPKAEIDTVVTILITSEIENTKPLLVRRKLAQNLGEVRKAWCSHQKFGEEMSDSIILTWKGRRLFDATTCKALGINESENNDNTMFPASDDGPFGSEEGTAGVHMQAMTSDSFEAERRRIAKSLQDHGRESSEDEPKVQAPEGDIVRITLKNPDLGDFKIKVRPSTRINNIINKFREMKSVPADKSVSFFFDGDRLGPESLIGDNDIDDLDCIDVVLK